MVMFCRKKAQMPKNPKPVGIVITEAAKQKTEKRLSGIDFCRMQSGNRAPLKKPRVQSLQQTDD